METTSKKPYILHLRDPYANNRPYATVVVKEDEDGAGYTGSFSLVVEDEHGRPLDNFSKKTGREIALQKIAAGKSTVKFKLEDAGWDREKSSLAWALCQHALSLILGADMFPQGRSRNLAKRASYTWVCGSAERKPVTGLGKGGEKKPAGFFDRLRDFFSEIW